MERAALHAIAYRHHVAEMERMPAACYGEMLAAFEMPIPETGGDTYDMGDDWRHSVTFDAAGAGRTR